MMKLIGCQQFESLFKIKALTTINDNFGLAFNSTIRKSNIASCLIECLTNDDCAFAKFTNGACRLYNENAKRFSVPSVNEQIIYEVVCANNPCKNEATCMRRGSSYDCLCTIGYFGKDCSLKIIDYICQTNHVYSFKQNKCVPCPVNFISDNRYPFKCYLGTNKYLNYSQTVEECAKYNLTVMRPKSLNERQMIEYRFGSSNWVDSKITKLGATYLWGDGTKVYGFGNNEPNNGGNFNDLVENSLQISGGCFTDASESLTSTSVYESTDSNEYL
ncbi:unnamed protein product [Brachionus calyciflorus]|uniref:Uncharacterized protein n=1 Tax=Brachionus calyciflorus TaxID=104777 RepID=A0A814HF92_9BILA|nr:unnamed protein product [Brachionus calyciflorus]